ncbi:hypothetical protein IG631_03777 [Alternaria alternata]|nr:hypothetical protein IG631_03777 [Alternaria alternata]
MPVSQILGLLHSLNPDRYPAKNSICCDNISCKAAQKRWLLFLKLVSYLNGPRSSRDVLSVYFASVVSNGIVRFPLIWCHRTDFDSTTYSNRRNHVRPTPILASASPALVCLLDYGTLFCQDSWRLGERDSARRTSKVYLSYPTCWWLWAEGISFRVERNSLVLFGPVVIHRPVDAYVSPCGRWLWCFLMNDRAVCSLQVNLFSNLLHGQMIIVRPTQKLVYLRACSRIRAKDAEEARARAIGLGSVANQTYHLGNVVCSAVCNEGGAIERLLRSRS